MGMSYEEAIDYVQNFMQDRPSKVKELALTDGIDRSHFSKDNIRCEVGFEHVLDYMQDFMSEPQLVFTDGVDRSRFAKDDIRCKAGLFWYAFAGGKFSSNPKAYPNCQGVVGWINPDPNASEGDKVYIVLPEQACLKYSSEYCETGADDWYDGRTNTRKLLEYGKKRGVKFPAAEFAFNYTKNGVKKGEAFLPAREQLVRLCRKTKGLRKSLKMIGGKFEGWLVSSSEYSNFGAWFVNSNNGSVDYHLQNYNGSVSCIIAY